MRKNKSTAGIIIIVLIALIIVTIINTLLVFNMTAEETRNSGAYQLESIVAELDKGIISAKNSTSEIAIQAQPLLEDKDALAEFIYAKKDEIAKESNGMGFNVYVAGTDFQIIPNLNDTEGYVATERIWYRGAINNNGAIYVSDPYADIVTGDICYTVSKELLTKGIVIAIDCSLAKIQEEIEKISISNNNEAVLVSGDGVVAACSNTTSVGTKLQDSFPDLAGIFALAKTSDTTVSSRIKNGLFNNNLFATGTDSRWYLIVSINDWELYRAIYIWLFVAIVLNAILFSVVFMLYYISKINERKAQDALDSKDKFLRAVTGDLKSPLNQILNNSNSKAFDEDINYEARFEAIQDATKQLSESIQQIISYSNYVKEEKEKSTKQSVKKYTRVSSRFRNLILGLMALSMLISVISISWMTSRWCKARMREIVGEYNNTVSEWVLTQESILDMFCSHIATNPDLLDDYDATIEYLDKITSRYEEVSATYIANKDFSPTVYMNNGWKPDENFRVEDRQWYMDAINNDYKYNISSPYIDVVTGLYCITISEKVYNYKTGEFIGVFGIDFYMDKLVDILGKSYADKNYAFLTDNRGMIINHPNGTYQMRVGNTTNIANLPYSKVKTDGDDVMIFTDYDDDLKVMLATENEYSGFKVYIVFYFLSIYGRTIIYGSIALFASLLCVIVVYRLLGRLITWQEEMNNQLQEAADSAIAAGKAKSDFLAMMSHEIRTPINAIIGMNEMILRESPRDDIKGYARKIRSASKTLLSLINSILDFSKIEEGKLEIIAVNYETRNLLNDVINMIIPRFKNKDLELKLEIDPGLPRGMYGDDVRIKQIILNILTNAVKYTEKGSVTLSVSGSACGKEHVMIDVKVTDTGIGIKDADIDKLNALFQRLDEKRNRNIEGTGLGISIVTSLLKMMGSHLEVKSVYGEGSEFSFELKQKVTDWGDIGEFNLDSVVSEEQETSDKYLVADHADILVVDDNDMNLAVIEGLLKRNRISPDFATSGAQCIEEVRKKHYDIVLLDHMMPEMDGIETLEQLRKNNILRKDTTVIALTANAVVGAREEYLAAGFNDYLSKPVDPNALEKMLGKYLPDYKISYEEAKAEPKKETKTMAKAPEPVHTAIGSNENFEDSDIIEFVPGSPIFESADSGESNNEVIRALEKLSYIDTKAAIPLCGSEDAYITILQMFIRTADIKKKRIKELYEKKDIKNYIIEIHALKSSARLIGAMEFSELARELELAGKENNLSVIEEKTDEIFVWYDKIKNEISSIIS
ncbi:response regulator [Butyrivibrio sp. VCD2006]|uniref:response regulator n=1 Tax=Butyrivibrio sp. VCD2006 TaxID=1280664 RepID=UPI000413412C|nr:response regulator [Butyrivibrio sp. VCD2006]